MSIHRSNLLSLCAAPLLLTLGMIAQTQAAEFTIYANTDDSELQTLAFGVSDLQAAMGDDHTSSVEALSSLPSDPSASFIFAAPDDSAVLAALDSAGGAAPGSLVPEGFSIRTTGSGSARSYWCFGDRVGLMYGALEFAELIKNGNLSSVPNKNHNPYLEKRGLKMNIPLDARTPSYADWGSSAQANIEVVWDMDFWHDQLDRMARNRYNCYTLWNLSPFPSLVKTPGFEEIALDHVMKANSNIDLVERNDDYSTKGRNMVDDELLANLKTVQSISIEQKIAFWQAVMEYGHNRGIEFHLYTWNVFVYGAHARPDLTESMDNNKTKDYVRASVRALINTYPRLAGIGITAGENMARDGQSINKAEKEERAAWLSDTYGDGVLAALEDDPSRHFRFVHRAHQADEATIDEYFSEIVNHDRIQFDMSTKYVKAQVYAYAGTSSQARNDDIDDPIAGDGGKWWLNLRNDGIFNFRWGDYEFTQDFLNYLSTDLDKVRGFHMGSDGYVWGREFTDKDPQFPRQLEHDKHWLKFMLWGRLGFDPATDASRFSNEAQRRLDIEDASLLMSTWATASKIIPAVNREHYYGGDYQWHPEYNHDRRDEFWHGFNSDEPGESGDPDWIKRASSDWDEVADELEGYAESVLANLPALRTASSGKEYLKTLNDLECFAHLGNFYAERVRGGHYFDVGNNSQAKNSAIAGAQHWLKYAELASSLYADQVLGRVRAVSWLDLYQRALDDIPGSYSLNELPQVDITSPVTNSILFPSPVSAEIFVTASDPDGTVDIVELFVNGALVDARSLGDGDYQLTASNLTTGTHLVEVRATDNDGGTMIKTIVLEVTGGTETPLEALPWIENFNTSNGTTTDGAPTSWTASRADGTFEVQGNQLVLNDGSADDEGILISGIIDLAGNSVEITLDVESDGGLEDDQDYVQLWAKVDGADILLDQVWGVTTGNTLSGAVTSGSFLQVIIRGVVSNGSETYLIDNLSVTPAGAVNLPPMVTIDSPTASASFMESDSITVEVSGFDDDGWISQISLTNNGDLVGSLSGPGPHTFNLGMLDAGSYTLIATATDNDGATKSESISISVVADDVGAPNTITHLVLIDAETDLPVPGVAPILDGDSVTFDLAALGVSQASIQAVTDSVSVVRFKNDDTGKMIRKDTLAPFFISADDGGDIQQWSGLTADAPVNLRIIPRAGGVNGPKFYATISLTTGVDDLIDADFASDVEGFAYVDDVFRATSQPNYASGVYEPAGGVTDGGLAVTLGGVNSADIDHMSGAWRKEFAVATPTDLTILLTYSLDMSVKYDSGEEVEVIVAVDGIETVLSVTEGGGQIPWVTESIPLGVVEAGTHTLEVGGYNNRKTSTGEEATIRFDNIAVVMMGSS